MGVGSWGLGEEGGGMGRWGDGGKKGVRSWELGVGGRRGGWGKKGVRSWELGVGGRRGGWGKKRELGVGSWGLGEEGTGKLGNY
uniref:Uncharacterized protein n=1 Tax=Desertifilum tharense IPPAS B-1220 TaxID=1781255 RepID=A0ACD5GY55_9CYAN